MLSAAPIATSFQSKADGSLDNEWPENKKRHLFSKGSMANRTGSGCSLCTVEALEKHRKHAEEFREKRKSIAFFIVSWDGVIDKIS